MGPPRLLRTLWPGPVSLLALLPTPLVLLAGGTVRRVAGAIEIQGGIVTWFLTSALPRLPLDALTLGHVVWGRNPSALEESRTHERVHVRQYERWGLLFPFLYLGASALAKARGLDPYRDNPFEREATQ